VVVTIIIPVALLHFVTGKNYTGPFPHFVNGYLIDILLPFSLYFLLILPDFKLAKSWILKCVIVFAIGCIVEILQYFGMPIFGQTFDPLDFVAYASGVILAAIFDLFLFPRIIPFWKP
jgi:hypothetical protein